MSEMPQSEPLFRGCFVAVFLSMMAISGISRRRARRRGGTIPRSREGQSAILLRLLVAVPLFAAIVTYAIHPPLMAWSSLPLPDWIRWVGVAGAISTLPVIYSLFRSIGRNISETWLTKADHELVTDGPYRYVRHPLYAASTGAFVSLGLVAANGFILGMALIAFGSIALYVVPREEAELTRKFGDAYREYSGRTARFLPGIW